MTRNRRTFACFFAALIVALAAGCVSTSRQDSTGEYVSDAVLTTQVTAALFNEPTLKSDEIKVQTYRGVVRLSGFVSSTADEDTAVAIARGVAGVKSVKVRHTTQVGKQDCRKSNRQLDDLPCQRLRPSADRHRRSASITQTEPKPCPSPHFLPTSTRCKRARQHIDDGSVTAGYSADRKIVLKLLNDSLATELVCVLRYRRHHFMARGIHSQSVAQEFLDHSNRGAGTCRPDRGAHRSAGRSAGLRPGRTRKPQPCGVCRGRFAGEHDQGRPGGGTHRHRQLPRHHPVPRRPGSHHLPHDGGDPCRRRSSMPTNWPVCS